MAILTFEFNPDRAQWRKGKFEIDELKIIGDAEDLNIKYDNIKFYLDNELYRGGINTWAYNDVSTDFLFNSVLNSYLRNNTAEFDRFGEEWSMFNDIKNLTQIEDGYITKLPVCDASDIDEYEIKMYELDLAVNDYFYYSYNDECMILDTKGEIITDMEHLYFNSLVEDVCDIIKGKITKYYKGKNKNVDYMIEASGGEEGFLADFDMD